VTDRGIESELLHAYHDGELGPFTRWRTKRRLDRDPAARAELTRLTEVRTALREAASGAPTADFWPGIAARLGAADAGLDRGGETGRATAPERVPALAGLRAWLRPLAAGALAAAAAAAWLVFSAPTEAVNGGVVRWLYTRGRPVMVLDRPDAATIIWMLDETPGDQTGRRIPGVYI
jgi:anti-sigma factor RsiW